MTIIPRDVNGKVRPEAVESVLSAMQATINASVEHDARDIGGLAVASAQTKSGSAGLPKLIRRLSRFFSPRAWASMAGALSMAMRGVPG